MTSMSYCKYENTLAALRQCAEDWENDRLPLLNEYEAKAKKELILVMKHLLVLEGFTVEGSADQNEYIS